MIDNHWFTEIHAQEDSAFSLRLNARLHAEKTPYQTIEIYDTVSFGKLMVIDGCVMLTQRDNFIYHEMMSHPALFTHSHPQRVVIIGGGDCGTLQEVLKHHTVTQVIQIDIDERVTRLAEQYFPELCAANHDPRAVLHFEDGIRWMREAKESEVDVIIVDSTDPVGPAEGLFGEAFYANCWRVLRAGGILAQQSESPLYHWEKIIKPMRKAMRAAGFNHTRTLHFPQCVYPSGWWSATLAGKNNSLEDFRESASRQKNFYTRYYHAAMHQASFALPYFMYLEDRGEKTEDRI